MRRRAIADLTQLSDDLFFKEIAQGLRYVLIEEQPPTTMRLSAQIPMEISILIPGSGTHGFQGVIPHGTAPAPNLWPDRIAWQAFPGLHCTQ